MGCSASVQAQPPRQGNGPAQPGPAPRHAAPAHADQVPRSAPNPSTDTPGLHPETPPTGLGLPGDVQPGHADGALHSGGALPGPVSPAQGETMARNTDGQSSRPSSKQAKGSGRGGSRPHSANLQPNKTPASSAQAVSAGAPAPCVAQAEPIRVTRDEHPLAAVSKGISLRGLRRLRSRLIEFFGEATYASLSTADVNTAFVQTVTAEHRCRLAELPSEVDPRDVGTPAYFISHAWKNRFELLLSGVEGFLESADEETRVWIDIIAVNQHSDTPYQALDVAAFKDVVRASSAGTLVVLDLSSCNPASRAWCIYEWAATLATHGPDGLHMPLAAAERVQMVAGLDVAAAECFNPQDKVMILGDVVAQHGSVQEFNERLQLQLQLQPLSYRVDLRRLQRYTSGGNGAAGGIAGDGAGSAAAWEWDFARVREWAAAAQDVPGARALCVLGGPGEGKSTIAAALVAGLAAGGGPPPAAAATPAPGIAAETETGTGTQDVGSKTDPETDDSTGKGESYDGVDTSASNGAGVQVAAYHLIKYSDARRLDPVRALGSLAFQLAERLPELRPHVSAANSVELAATGDAELAFAKLLKAPLAAAAAAQAAAAAAPAAAAAESDAEAAALQSGPADQEGQQREQQLFLLLDGLDEADPPPPPTPLDADNAPSDTSATTETASAAATGTATTNVCGNKLFQLLAKQLKTLPRSVRFILTARPDAVGGSTRDALDRAFADAGGVTYVTPQQLRCSRGTDNNGMSGELMKGVAEQAGIGSRAGGGEVLVYQSIFDTCLRPMGLSPGGGTGSTTAAVGVGSASLTRRPQMADLHAAFGAVFAAGLAKLDAAGLASVNALLGVLLAAQEPLPQSLLHAMGLGPAVCLLPGYPVTFFEDEHRLHMLHKTLADWLGGAPAAARRADPRVVTGADAFAAAAATRPAALRADLRDGHARLAQRLLLSVRCAREAAAAAAADTIGASRNTGGVINAYALRYLVRHLVACGDGPSLDGLLRDYDFLSTAFAQGHGHALLRDLLRASRPSPLVSDCQRWLLAQQHALAAGAGNEKGAAAGVAGAEAVVVNALRACPVRTAAFRAAEEHALAAALAAGRPRWRLRHALGAPQDWPVQRMVLEGHSGFAKCVAWSPDGGALASGGDDRTVRLWDAGSGECLAVLLGHAAGVRGASWSPDGRTLASSGGDRTLRLWDTASGECITILEGHAAKVDGVAWSPDGATLASCGGGDKTLRLWRADSGECTATLEHPDEVTCVAWSPDGRTLASGCWDGALRLWDAASGQCSATLLGHTDGVWSIAWSPNGRFLASGSKDHSVRLWDTASGACTATLEAHRWAVYSVAWSPDGAFLASGGSGDSLVRLWDAASGQCIATLEGHEREISSLAWRPDGRALASASWDGSVRMWEPHRAGAAAPGALRGSGGGGDGGMASSFQGHSHAVFGVSWRPDGGALASGGKDGALRLWDADSGRCTATLLGHRECVFSVAWSPDGHDVASGSGDFSVRLWDAASGQKKAVLQGHTEAVSCVAWSPGGGKLASSSLDGSVRVWDAASHSCLAVLEGHSAYVKCVAWSPDGCKLLSGGDDRTLRLWNAGSGQCTATLEGHASAINSVAWSPDGRQVASGSSDTSVRLWDPSSAACSATYAGHAAPVFCVAWSPDGCRVASCSFDKTVRLWDTASGGCFATIQGHSDLVLGVAWRPDGRALASSSWDRSVRVYALEAEPVEPVP